MNQRVIAGEPEIVVSINEHGEIVLAQAGEDAEQSIHIPHQKIHQVTVWMRRLAAQLEGLRAVE